MKYYPVTTLASGARPALGGGTGEAVWLVSGSDLDSADVGLMGNSCADWGAKLPLIDLSIDSSWNCGNDGNDNVPFIYYESIP